MREAQNPHPQREIPTPREHVVVQTTTDHALGALWPKTTRVGGPSGSSTCRRPHPSLRHWRLHDGRWHRPRGLGSVLPSCATNSIGSCFCNGVFDEASRSAPSRCGPLPETVPSQFIEMPSRQSCLRGGLCPSLSLSGIRFAPPTNLPCDVNFHRNCNAPNKQTSSPFEMVFVSLHTSFSKRITWTPYLFHFHHTSHCPFHICLSVLGLDEFSLPCLCSTLFAADVL